MATLLLNDKWDLFFLSKKRPGEGIENGSFPAAFYFTGIARPEVSLATKF